MRLLLDTHVLLWLQAEPDRVPATLRELLSDPETVRTVSVVTAWEVAVKHAAGRLSLPQEPEDWLRDRLFAMVAETLDVTLPHVLRAAALPRHHGDPFDRLLVAQAQIEDLTLVTSDRQLSAYDVQTRWA